MAANPDGLAKTVGASDTTAPGAVGYGESAYPDGLPETVGTSSARLLGSLANPDGLVKHVGAIYTASSDSYTCMADTPPGVSGAEAAAEALRVLPTPTLTASTGHASDYSGAALFRSSAPVLDLSADALLDAACPAASTRISRTFFNIVS